MESCREGDIFYKKLIDKYINKKRSLTHAIEVYEQFYQESLGEPSRDVATASTHGANGEPPRSMEARSVTSPHPVQLDTIASVSITIMEHQQITTTSPARGTWTVCPATLRQTSTLPMPLLRNRSALTTLTSATATTPITREASQADALDTTHHMLGTVGTSVPITTSTSHST